MSRLFNTAAPLNHAVLHKVLDALVERYSVPVLNIGFSILGRDLPALRLGEGPKKLLYVGARTAAFFRAAARRCPRLLPSHRRGRRGSSEGRQHLRRPHAQPRRGRDRAARRRGRRHLLRASAAAKRRIRFYPLAGERPRRRSQPQLRGRLGRGQNARAGGGHLRRRSHPLRR